MAEKRQLEIEKTVQELKDANMQTALNNIETHLRKCGPGVVSQCKPFLEDRVAAKTAKGSGEDEASMLPAWCNKWQLLPDRVCKMLLAKVLALEAYGDHVGGRKPRRDLVNVICFLANLDARSAVAPCEIESLCLGRLQLHVPYCGRFV